MLYHLRTNLLLLRWSFSAAIDSPHCGEGHSTAKLMLIRPSMHLLDDLVMMLVDTVLFPRDGDSKPEDKTGCCLPGCYGPTPISRFRPGASTTVLLPHSLQIS